MRSSPRASQQVRFTVTDSNVNTYIGSNAGPNASNTAQNTGLGFEAMAAAITAFSNVAIGASNQCCPQCDE
jgi:hypothetical protein